jgi:predicted molibdopterin-dependent oxidoreductase YjgC
MIQTLNKTFCRVCASLCGLEVVTESERVLSIRGDRDHPLSRGFMCIKGQMSQDFQTERTD